jgi:hypothetical protein
MAGVPYEILKGATDNVVGALRREGGELTYPELTELTHLPSRVVEEVVQKLKTDNRVEVTQQEGTGLKIVHLRGARNPFRGFTHLFGGDS